MNDRLIRAVRAMRTAYRRIRTMASDRSTTFARPSVQPYTAGQAADPCEPDTVLLAALMLSGLMDPATATTIAALETDHRRSQSRTH